MCDEKKLGNDEFYLDLFHRALGQHDDLAWEFMQRHYRNIMFHWFQRHSQKEMALRFDSAENYVALGFERFWQAAACNQHMRFNTVAAVMDYLRASLNSAILDTLRAYARPHTISLSDIEVTDTPLSVDQEDPSQVWETIVRVLTNEHERRVAYLLFHCGLKPRQICQYCPQEFDDVDEIYRLRRNIMERFIRNADFIQWQLSGEEREN